jgi:hypothetical protein
MCTRHAIAVAVLALASMPAPALAQYAYCSKPAIVPLAGLGGIEGVYSKTQAFGFAVAPELAGGFGVACYDTTKDAVSPWTFPFTVSTGAAIFPGTIGSVASDGSVAGQSVFQTLGVYTGFLWSLTDPQANVVYPVGVVAGYQWLFAKLPYATPAGSGIVVMLNFPLQFRIPPS